MGGKEGIHRINPIAVYVEKKDIYYILLPIQPAGLFGIYFHSGTSSAERTVYAIYVQWPHPEPGTGRK